MKFFVDYLDKEIWNVISNNDASSKNERDHLDCIDNNIIVFALDSDEFLKVS